MECPDCGKFIDKVLVEKFSYKEFDINHETKVITPMPNHDWEYNDYAYRCPNPECQSLNIDSDLDEYSLADGLRSLM